MKISLIDVDGKMPNLALMKIAAWHKSQGDEVKWYDPLFDRPDRVYASKIFNFTPDYDNWPDCEIVRGGTGYDLKVKLPESIERMTPDYTIYPKCDYAIGFLTRGCINHCSWCVVPEKEGNLRPDRAWVDIARSDSRKVVLLDNNVLAGAHGLNQLAHIADFNRMFPKLAYSIDCNQGIDARLIDRDMARFLCSLKWIRFMRLACDTKAMIEPVRRAIRHIIKFKRTQEIFVYLLVTEDVADAAARSEALAEFGNVSLFAQPFRDPRNPNHQISDAQTMFARYVNIKGGQLCRKMKWSEYRRTGKTVDRDTPDLFDIANSQ